MPSFEQLDTDKNGCITLDEYGIALRLIKQRSGASSLQFNSGSSKSSSNVPETTTSGKHPQFAEHSNVFNKSQIGAPRRRLVEDYSETTGEFGGYSEMEEASSLTAPPSPPPSSSPLPSAYSLLTVVSGPCQTSSEGTCMQSPNYPANYNTDDNCEVSVDGEGFLYSLSFHTEASYDIFFVGSTPYSGDEGPNGHEVDSSVALRFTSDYSITKSGFEVCITTDPPVPSSPPPPSPPPSPFPPPAPPPTPPPAPSPPASPPAPPLDTNGTVAYVTLSEYAQSHLGEAVGNVHVNTIIISVNWQLDPSDVSAYPLNISRTLHIAGECLDGLCEVDGGEQGPLFYILDGGALLLERLSLTNFFNTNGGVIRLSLGTLVINACDMSRNHASESGGVLHAIGGNVTITNSNMTDNTATYNGGVADIRSSGDVSISGCIMTGNTAARYGGVAHISSSGDVSISECTMTGNIAAEFNGGVAYIDSSGDVSISGCVMTGNIAAEFNGGVAYIDSSGDVSISGCVMTGNTAAKFNGGVAYIDSSGDVSISGCVMTGNTAAKFNGGVAYIDSSGDVYISECNMTGNTAVNFGGSAFMTQFG
ncbi:hypothetical protein CYMTET_26540, partial [Cymbomonas tetramitiformis]